jgi:hypothetical protein
MVSPRSPFFLSALLLVLVSVAAPDAKQAASKKADAAVTITADAGISHYFQGMGGSQYEEIGWDRIPAAKRAELCQAIWGEDGLNFNILKLWLSQWETDLQTTLDRYAQTVADVKAVRPDVIIQTSGNTRVAIPNSDLQKWADHQVGIIKGLRDNDIKVDVCGIYNEPNAYAKLTDPGVPMCVKLFRQTLDAQGLDDVKIIAPECSMVDQGCENMIQAIADDDEAVGIIDGFATHCYNMCMRRYIYDMEDPFDKNHWMTESSHDGIGAAQYFLSDLNLGCTHWVHFFAFWYADSGRTQYGIMDPGGTKYAQYNVYKQMLNVFPYGSAMRLCACNLTSSDGRAENMENTYGAQTPIHAAVGVDADKRLGMAVANTGGSAYATTFSIAELSGKGGQYEMAVTKVTNSGGILPQSPVTLANGSVTVNVGVREMITLRSNDAVDMDGGRTTARPAPVSRAPSRLTARTNGRDRLTVVFDVPEGARGVPVRLDVYRTDGARIRSLVNAPLSPGRHKIRWESGTGAGRHAAPGMYLLRLDCPTLQEDVKLLVR